jgi:hypothetical protein
MRIIRALFAALALMLAGLTISTAPAGAAPRAIASASYTDCNQSSGLGTRICVDETTGFGPVLYVFTPGLSTSIGISLSSTLLACSSFRTTSEPANGGDWYIGNQTVTYIGGTGSRCAGTSIIATLEGGSADNAITLPAWLHNQIELYSMAAGYEFVWAN